MVKKILISFISLLFFLLFSDPAFCANAYGKVINQSNNAVAYAIVSFTQNGNEVARSITGNDGRFFIRNIPNGTYVVKIISGNQTHERPNIVVGNSNNNFEFKI